MKKINCREDREDFGKASIYGFGSFFEGKNIFQDIDLLVLHYSITEKSCKFAILCKNILQSKIPYAHVTLLSISGEFQHNFIKRSNAIFLGNVFDISVYHNIDKIIKTKIKKT